MSNLTVLFDEYVDGKQTYKQLAIKHGKSISTIQRRLDKVGFKLDKLAPSDRNEEVIIGMDSFYFGRSFGVMLFRDIIKGKNLHWMFIQHETVELYKEGIHYLQSKGYVIKGIVCDGKKGLFQAFPCIPVQMCQFHQVQITRRYLTSKPKLPAAIELKNIMEWLTVTDKESFTGAFNDWMKKWEPFLKEKSIDMITGKWHYTHKRLRSAAHSIKINLPSLFTWYDYFDLNIPNTNNSVEGTISNIKVKTKVHQGLKRHRKIKLIEKLLRN